MQGALLRKGWWDLQSTFLAVCFKMLRHCIMESLVELNSGDQMSLSERTLQLVLEDAVLKETYIFRKVQTAFFQATALLHHPVSYECFILIKWKFSYNLICDVAVENAQLFIK